MHMVSAQSCASLLREVQAGQQVLEVLNRWVLLGVLSADGLGASFHFFCLGICVVCSVVRRRNSRASGPHYFQRFLQFNIVVEIQIAGFLLEGLNVELEILP